MLLPIVAGLAAVGQSCLRKCRVMDDPDINNEQTPSLRNVYRETAYHVIGTDSQPITDASVGDGDPVKSKAAELETGSSSEIVSDADGPRSAGDGNMSASALPVYDVPPCDSKESKFGSGSGSAPSVGAHVNKTPATMLLETKNKPLAREKPDVCRQLRTNTPIKNLRPSAESSVSETGSRGLSSEDGGSSCKSEELQEMGKMAVEMLNEVMPHVEHNMLLNSDSIKIKQLKNDLSQFPSGVSSASMEEDGSSSGTKAEKVLEGFLVERASAPSEPKQSLRLNLPSSSESTTGLVPDSDVRAEDDAKSSDALPVDRKPTEYKGTTTGTMSPLRTISLQPKHWKRRKVEGSESNSSEGTSSGGDGHALTEAEKISECGNEAADVGSGSPTIALSSSLGFTASTDSSVVKGQGEVRELKLEREEASVLDSEQPAVSDTTAEGEEVGSTLAQFCELSPVIQRVDRRRFKKNDTSRTHKSLLFSHAKDLAEWRSWSREEVEATQEGSKPESIDSAPGLEVDEPPVTVPVVECEGARSGSHAQVPTAINNDTDSLVVGAKGSNLTDNSIGGSALSDDNTSQKKAVRKRQRGDSPVGGSQPCGLAVSAGSRAAESYATADLGEEAESSLKTSGSLRSLLGIVEGMGEPREDSVSTTSFCVNFSFSASPKTSVGADASSSTSIAEARSAPSFTVRGSDGTVEDDDRPGAESLITSNSSVRENEGRGLEESPSIDERSEDTGSLRSSTDGKVEERVGDDGRSLEESPILDKRSEATGRTQSSTQGENEERLDDGGSRGEERPILDKRSEGTGRSRSSTDGGSEEQVDDDGRSVEESSISEGGPEGPGRSAASHLHMEKLQRIGGLLNYTGEPDAYMGSESRKPYKRCISALLRGFLVGAGLQGAISLISILDRLRRRASKRSTAGLKPIDDAVIAGVKKSLRYGMFVGSYAGSFCTIDEILAAAFGGPSAKWRRLVAGALAGPSLLFTGAENTSMALYILVRAAVLAARAGIWSSNLGWLCRPLTWRHGDIFLMCLSSSQILWSWIMKPSSLPSSYVSFINKLGNKHPSILKGIREVALKQRPLPSLPEIRDHYLLEGSYIDFDPQMEIPCTIIHGSRSCLAHCLSYFLGAYIRAIPVYIPVHVAGSLFVHRTNLFRRGTRLMFLSKISLGIARSSLFLATYAASAWLWTCGLFRATGTCTPALVAAGTFPTGLALLLEQKSRRMEISMYCLSRALESFAISVSDSKLARRHNLSIPKRIDVFLFSLGAAIIMHCHGIPDPEGRIIRPKYRNVLNWVLGYGSMQWVFDQPCFRKVLAHYLPPPNPGQRHAPR